MSLANSTSAQSIRYNRRTLARAERAVKCAPFQLRLFVDMGVQGVSLRAIAAHSGVQNGYTQGPIAEIAVESELLWLIQVGLLRREVDGQGLTDSFRLTPLGRHLVDQWKYGRPWLKASWGDRLTNALTRWVRLPSWL